MTPEILETLRSKLCALETYIQQAVLSARQREQARFAEVVEITAADTIYFVDKISEDAIVEWFGQEWPADQPVEVIMEGLEDGAPLCFPTGTTPEQAKWKVILDPIDGTRNIMYDKRSAWILGAIAPNKGPQTNLRDIVVGALTELPTAKQNLADQISGVRGCGPDGIVAERCDIHLGTKAPLPLRPSGAQDLKGGFASLVRFFPEGKGLTAQMEEALFDKLYGLGKTASPLVFDDQYIATGGQIYELLIGHDRMLGDLRPLVLAKLGYDSALVCHPYDICCAFLLEEAGGILESPEGNPLNVPLDTTSAVSWIGYANPTIAASVRPVLTELIQQYLR